MYLEFNCSSLEIIQNYCGYSIASAPYVLRVIGK